MTTYVYSEVHSCFCKVLLVWLSILILGRASVSVSRCLWSVCDGLMMFLCLNWPGSLIYVRKNGILCQLHLAVNIWAKKFKRTVNLWVCAMASGLCGYCALMPWDTVATFGLLEMNKRVQLFFSWWLCVIAAQIYLLCTGNLSSVGPVLCLLSHQDLAQQQSYSD